MALRVRATALALMLIVRNLFIRWQRFLVRQSDETRACVGAGNQAVELEDSQKTILLDEANEEYQRAMESKENDAAEASSAFASAAQKYQLLVDSGVHNAGLYFNLGNAYLQSDSLGRAIANFERSKKLRPFDSQVRRNLAVRQFFG